MRLTAEEVEAVEYLRLWARAGFPKRVDGSFPTDFLTSMRRVMGVPMEKINSRTLEAALVAGPDFDYVLPRHHQWSSRSQIEAQKRLAP